MMHLDLVRTELAAFSRAKPMSRAYRLFFAAATWSAIMLFHRRATPDRRAVCLLGPRYGRLAAALGTFLLLCLAARAFSRASAVGVDDFHA